MNSNGILHTMNLLQQDDQKQKSNRDDQIQNTAKSEAFKVYVRVRPLSLKEQIHKNNRKKLHIIKVLGQNLLIQDPSISTDISRVREKQFEFDANFDESQSTQKVYQQTMAPLLENILSGYNATMFAFGMTGAGKTHTLFGEMNPNLINNDNMGITLRTLNDIFVKTQNDQHSAYSYKIKFSYIEIYNEHVKDLIKGDNSNLMILEDPIKGVTVNDLTETPIFSSYDALRLITIGNQRRQMASTSQNQFSSRSHAIVQVTIDRYQKEQSSENRGFSNNTHNNNPSSNLSSSRSKTSNANNQSDYEQNYNSAKLCLIDLAGSERAATTDNRGQRMVEGANINKSLLSLGNCINILSDPSKKGAFVPYRDSKLTRLLKDSLGGNTKTIMITCISPSSQCYEETINSLKYASRAKRITRRVTQNVKQVEVPAVQYQEIIKGLKDEIQDLKDQLKTQRGIEIIRKDINYNNTDEINKIKYLRTESLKEQQKLPTPLQTANLIQEDKSSICLVGDDAFDDEKKIDETSHKILEQLEQNFEISQTLRELNNLEVQNKDTLAYLYNSLEQQQDCNTVKQQINSLKYTMSHNENIKKEVQQKLKVNMMATRALKEGLLDFAKNCSTEEDIELAKKFIDIESLDLVTQNLEIKKEALELAQQRIDKDKKIVEMEQKLKKLQEQIDQKDQVIATNHKVINQLQKKIEVPQIEMHSNQNYAAKQQQSQFMTSNNFQDENVAALQQSHSSKCSEVVDKKATMLKGLLSNLEQKINKSLFEIDERLNTNSYRKQQQQQSRNFSETTSKDNLVEFGLQSQSTTYKESPTKKVQRQLVSQFESQELFKSQQQDFKQQEYQSHDDHKKDSFYEKDFDMKKFSDNLYTLPDESSIHDDLASSKQQIHEHQSLLIEFDPKQIPGIHENESKKNQQKQQQEQKQKEKVLDLPKQMPSKMQKEEAARHGGKFIISKDQAENPQNQENLQGQELKLSELLNQENFNYNSPTIEYHEKWLNDFSKSLDNQKAKSSSKMRSQKVLEQQQTTNGDNIQREERMNPQLTSSQQQQQQYVSTEGDIPFKSPDSYRDIFKYNRKSVENKENQVNNFRFEESPPQRKSYAYSDSRGNSKLNNLLSQSQQNPKKSFKDLNKMDKSKYEASLMPYKPKDKSHNDTISHNDTKNFNNKANNQNYNSNTTTTEEGSDFYHHLKGINSSSSHNNNNFNNAFNPMSSVDTITKVTESLDKKLCEIKSLGQERENLKQFRVKLQYFRNFDIKKINEVILEEIRNLLLELNQKQYLLTPQEQDNVIYLNQVLHSMQLPKKSPKNLQSNQQRAKSSNKSYENVPGAHRNQHKSYKQMNTNNNSQQHSRQQSKGKFQNNNTPSNANSHAITYTQVLNNESQSTKNKRSQSRDQVSRTPNSCTTNKRVETPQRYSEKIRKSSSRNLLAQGGFSQMGSQYGKYISRAVPLNINYDSNGSNKNNTNNQTANTPSNCTTTTTMIGATNSSSEQSSTTISKNMNVYPFILGGAHKQQSTIISNTSSSNNTTTATSNNNFIYPKNQNLLAKSCNSREDYTNLQYQQESNSNNNNKISLLNYANIISSGTCKNNKTSVNDLFSGIGGGSQQDNYENFTPEESSRRISNNHINTEPQQVLTFPSSNRD